MGPLQQCKNCSSIVGQHCPVRLRAAQASFNSHKSLSTFDIGGGTAMTGTDETDGVVSTGTDDNDGANDGDDCCSSIEESSFSPSWTGTDDGTSDESAVVVITTMVGDVSVPSTSEVDGTIEGTVVGD